MTDDLLALTPEEAAMIARGAIIPAIKAVRNRLGLNLTQGRDVVRASPEYAAWTASQPVEPEIVVYPSATTRLTQALFRRDPTPQELIDPGSLLSEAADRIEALSAYVGRIESIGASDPDVVMAVADLLMAASWLARHDQQERAKTVQRSVDTLQAKITQLAARKA